MDWRMVIVSAVAGLSAASCAPVEPGLMAGGRTTAGELRQCFNAASVNGFRPIDRQTVDLNVGANRIYRVRLLGTCPEVRDAVSVGVLGRNGSSFICDDLDIDLIVPGAIGGPRRCPATSLRQMTRAELEAERAARRR